MCHFFFHFFLFFFENSKKKFITYFHIHFRKCFIEYVHIYPHPAYHSYIKYMYVRYIFIFFFGCIYHTTKMAPFPQNIIGICNINYICHRKYAHACKYYLILFFEYEIIIIGSHMLRLKLHWYTLCITPPSFFNAIPTKYDIIVK